MTMIPAIPTRYKGVQFRSRLEARWAAMFDQLGWKWEYEPIDLSGWIPDFRVGLLGLLVEVSPILYFPEHLIKIKSSGYKGAAVLLGESLSSDETNGCCTCSGSSRCVHNVLTCGISANSLDQVVLRESCHLSGDGICLSEDLLSYRCLLCDDYDGNSFVSERSYNKILTSWREAGNRTQWRGEGATP